MESLTFEQQLQRLEAIVAELEGDNLELSRALTLFQEGVECVRAATAELSHVESQVHRLIERSDGSFDVTDLGG